MNLSLPIVYRRPFNSRVLGCAVYAIALPVVCLFGCLFTFAISLAVFQQVLGAPPILAVSASFLLSLVFCVYVGWRAFRDYQLRVSDEVWLWPDRLERTIRGRKVVYPYAEIDREHLFHLSHHAGQRLVIVMRDGRALHVSGRALPVAEIAEVLRRLAVPVLVERSLQGIAQHESIEFPEPRARAAWVSISVVLAAVAGSIAIGMFFWNMFQGGNQPINVSWLGYAVVSLFALAALPRWLRVAMARGVVVTARGIRRMGEEFGSDVPWSAIKEIRITRNDLRIDLGGLQRPLVASNTIGNYAVLVELLRLRLPDSVPWLAD